MSKRFDNLNSSYQDIEEMMEDIRVSLHLGKEEFASALSILEKVGYGNLVFESGDLVIKFEGFCPNQDFIFTNGRNRVLVEVETMGKGVKRRVEYVIPHSLLKRLRLEKGLNVQGLVKKGKNGSGNLRPCHYCEKTIVEGGKVCPSCKIAFCHACILELKYVDNKNPDLCPQCGGKFERDGGGEEFE